MQSKEYKSYVNVTQIASTIRKPLYQSKILIGLGLNKKLHHTKTLEDTPSVRGMIHKVRHLLRVENVN